MYKQSNKGGLEISEHNSNQPYHVKSNEKKENLRFNISNKKGRLRLIGQNRKKRTLQKRGIQRQNKDLTGNCKRGRRKREAKVRFSSVWLSHLSDAGGA